ncbi:hypothetical protein HA402_008247 [Bradysia odoriphaga]|nr:hypothetical protein HA402_008247 [Bradysia odoriphaga]
MASTLNSQKPKDADDEILSKKMKSNKENDESNGEQKMPVELSLEIVFGGFKALPVLNEERVLDDLPEFLAKHGCQITKLNYTDDAGEKNRQLILQFCPNISEVTFEFTEYPDQVEDDESQRLVKFLTALAPGLTRLETINNLIGLHYLSCMGYIYENFSDKIKFVKTDELKPEELSVLSGDNNKDNPALSLEELVYCDNDFLYSTKRNSRSAESLALKPASLTDLVKLTNLRRIDLPFFLSKEKIPPVVAPLPLLNYASIRLLSHNRGKVAISSFTENIGKALANVIELKLTYADPGLFVLTSILKNCDKLEKLDLTDYHVPDNYVMGLETLSAIKNSFKQLEATISYKSHAMDVILLLMSNTPTLSTINIVDIDCKDDLHKISAAGIALSEKVEHNVEMNLTVRKSAEKDLPAGIPDNLKIDVRSN